MYYILFNFLRKNTNFSKGQNMYIVHAVIVPEVKGKAVPVLNYSLRQKMHGGMDVFL
jgi:hypothetical protein